MYKTAKLVAMPFSGLFPCYHTRPENQSYQSNEHALYDCLMKTYNKHIRPVRKESNQVTVEFGLTLINLAGVVRTPV